MLALGQNKARHLFFFSTLLIIDGYYSLYEDQIGLFDWRKQYIGRGKEIYFEHISHGSRRVFLTTEANVLAALNARTGQIMWRKILGGKNGNIESLRHNQNVLITLSLVGQQQQPNKIIRSWDKNNGNILWETNLIDTYIVSEDLEAISHYSKMLPKHQLVLLTEQTGGGGILVSSYKKVLLLSQADGSEVWEYSVSEDSGVYVIGVSPIEDENKVIVICLKKLSSNDIFINFKHVEIDTGKSLNEVVIKAPWLVTKDVTCELVSRKYFVCANPKSRHIMVKNFADLSNDAFYSTHISELIVEKSGAAAEKLMIAGLYGGSDNVFFTVSVNYDNMLLVGVNTNNRKIYLVKQMKNPGQFIRSVFSEKEYIFEIQKKSSVIHIEAYVSSDFSKPVDVLKSLFKIDEYGVVDVGSIYLYQKKNELNYRLVLSFEDYTIALVQNIPNDEGKVLWSRNEALSKISSVKMIELPPSLSTSKLELLHDEFLINQKGQVLSMFLNRFKSQVHQFQAFMQSLKRRQGFGNQDLGNVGNSKLALLSRDQFNTVKMIVAFTDGRKLFAINSQDGEIVWSKFLSTVNPIDHLDKFYIFEQRSTAHFPLPPQCLLIAPFNNIHKSGDEGTKTVIYSFNPLNGDGLSAPAAVEEYEILHVAILPYEDEQSLQMVVVVDTNLFVHIYPNTKESYAKLSKNIQSVYVYLANTSLNTFKGYKIKQGAELKLYEVWSVIIPDDQKILSLAEKRLDETVNSVGRVLGDHTVLYKYLNPNLLAVLAQQGSGAKGSVLVYVIDAVTGHIVYQVKHKGVSGPVGAILSENWLVYTYYNTKGRRYEISVAEFYEGYEEKNSTAFSSLDPTDAPVVISQSYLLPITGFHAMVSTCTERGITSKNILIGLDNGYVYSIPKNILDPRRSFKQTQMLQEEGLPPYIPELPLVAQGYINYNQTVNNIRGIHTSAAGLESTSLVLVYGLDVYFTRVMPSKMFDVLKEDFDYIFISGVLSALILGSVVCSKLASIKSLNLAWQ